METLKKTKSLRNIEEKMKFIDRDSLRYSILESAKLFKTSWISLGQALYSVYRDKLYKQWGYASIELYTARELGIKKQTAMKLLRSYYFLEKEEPEYLGQDYTESAEVGSLPTYESVDVLRMAKNKKNINAQDQNLKESIFEKGKDALAARRDLTAMIRQREELEPEEARQKKKIAVVKRFIGILRSLEREVETLKLLPQPLLKEAAGLIKKLEAEIS
jgi:hypothetical protein